VKIAKSNRKRPVIIKEYMEVLRPCLHFHGIQFKSLKAFKSFARHLGAIEETVGIHSVTISMEDIFVCPDIDWKCLFNEKDSATPMEQLLYGLIVELI
jgi:hypothetical protein